MLLKRAVTPPTACQQPGERAEDRWHRMYIRLLSRNRWHWHGILLWLIQRPYIRFLPPPLPSVSTTKEWEEQVEGMVKRGSWPKLWQTCLNLDPSQFSLFHLKECMHLRDRMGMELAFMEDEAILFGIQALKKKPRKKMQQALATETQRLLQLSETDRREQLRALLGPRGGLPRLKDELVKAAVLLNTKLEPDDTVEKIRQKLQPVVKTMMGKAEWNAPPPTSSSSTTAVVPKAKPTVAPSVKSPTKPQVVDLASGDADLLLRGLQEVHLQNLTMGEPRMPRLEWDVEQHPESMSVTSETSFFHLQMEEAEAREMQKPRDSGAQ